MKRFFKQIGLFCLPLVTMIGVFIGASTYHIRKNADFSIPPNCKNIIAGHSHAALAYNDSILQGYYNVAQTAEGYPYTYFKVKKILTNNEHIKNVYVEFTNNQIIKWSTARVWGEYFVVNQKRCFTVQDDFSFFLKASYHHSNIDDIFKIAKNVVKNNFNFLTQKDPSYINYFWRDTKDLHNVFDRNALKNNANKKVEKENAQSFSLEAVKEIENSVNFKYLIKIKEFCALKNVNLILLRSPFTNMHDQSNELIFQNLLERNFSDIEFLDFHEFPLPDSCFADANHLNKIGKDSFSTYLIQHVFK